MNTNISRARAILQRCERIVSFSGAGLSAESGIPTFRDTQEGLWARYDPMDLASPQGFARDPQMVSDWYNWRRTQLAEKTPNPAHLALASCDDMLHITQNVDDLLERAGTQAENLVHLHGRISADRCNSPACVFEEEIDLTSPLPLRPCPQCGDSMRPAVVWFGESLPPREWELAAEACMQCDVLLVIGTSAAVYPAAGLIDVSRQNGATIIVVNKDATDASRVADIKLIGSAGTIVPQLL